jgi:hypothetical protein
MSLNLLADFPFFSCELTDQEIENILQRHHPHFIKHFPKGLSINRTDCGLGVFTTRKLKADRKVGRVRGYIETRRDYTSEYCIDAGGFLSLEPAAPFCFLNHSCEPNCQFMNYLAVEEWEDEDHRRAALERAASISSRTNLAHTDAAYGVEMWLETLRNIEPGEQLTIDYAWSDDRAIPCLCGSPNCRGWIVAPELLNSFLRKLKRKNNAKK